MRAIDIIKKTAKGTTVEVRIEMFGTTFASGRMQETWLDKYKDCEDTKQLLDREITNLFAFEGDLILRV